LRIDITGSDRAGVTHALTTILGDANARIFDIGVTEIVDGARPAFYLSEIARRAGLNMEQVIAVGDGANDLPMLRLTGPGIAFREKPLVRQGARQALSTLGLDGIPYLLGVCDRETLVEDHQVT
jgi:phosphoserine phosphatase